jgi:hypothetical protein
MAGKRARQQHVVRGWDDIVLKVLKQNEVRLVTYLPDRVLTSLIAKIHADPFFTAFATTREEEAIGVLAGAWMGGMRGTLLMQTSGFATLANLLASLIVPNQIPAIMFVTPGVDAVDGAVGETFWPRGGLRRGTPATSATRSRSQVCERWPISLQIEGRAA